MGAAAGAGRDRLGVWNWEQHGEQVATGEDWRVTDAERAAAGRETVAGRFLALLAANRERAAQRYSDGGLPDDEDVVRVWRLRAPSRPELTCTATATAARCAPRAGPGPRSWSPPH